MVKGNYGSVLIHIKDGEVSGVSDKDDYNYKQFKSHVRNHVSRYVVKTKSKDSEKLGISDDQTVENEDQKGQNDHKNGTKRTGNTNDKS